MLNFKSYASSSAGNLYTVEDGRSRLMIDPGLPWFKVRELTNCRSSEVVAVLVGHSHLDHARGVSTAVRLGYDCWMSAETAKALQVDSLHRIEAGDRVHIGDWCIEAFATVHDCPGSLGFLVTNYLDERLCYAVDTQYLSPRWGDRCSIVALEANYELEKIKANVASGEVDRARKHRTMWNHQSIDTVLKFLKETDRSRLQEVWLLHLSDANADEQLFKRMVQEVTGCRVQIA